ncbi:MAG TPA: SufE family protein [Cellvibrio sp.]|nr:SufE family protein [Cellvibrio sp.]
MHHDDLSSISLEHLLDAGNWQQQYKLIIQWGKLISHKPGLRVPDNLIRGCEIPVWLACEQRQGDVYFVFDADSSVIKGLASLLLVQLNGRNVDELNEVDLEKKLRGLGLEKHLTPSRNNGLKGIIARIYDLLGRG